MPTIRLTQIAVDRLKPPATGRVEYWDNQLPGFGLRVAAPRPGQEGRKTWQVMYRIKGKLKRETLGTLSTIPKVETARDLARASMTKAQQGIDPVEERERDAGEARAAAEAELARQRDTVDAVIDRYLGHYAEKRMRPDYFRETKRTLLREVKPALGSKPIREITRRDVRELLEEVSGRGAPIMANRVLAYLRAMLNWAVANDLMESNPSAGLKMPAPAVDRDRALDDDESRLFWLACGDIGWPFGPLFKLLLLTVQRRDEVGDARWPEFELDKAIWTLPRERSKNGKAHLIHLSPLAIEIITTLPKIGTAGYLFTTNGETPVSGFSRATDRLRAAMLTRRQAELTEEGSDTAEIEQAVIEPFTLHDLRRTAATGMAGLGIAHHVIDKALNHASGTIRGVAAVYNRHAYLDERKAALDAWSRHVEGLVRAVPSKVVPIEKARRRRSA
jgi:integrase